MIRADRPRRTQHVRTSHRIMELGQGPMPRITLQKATSELYHDPLYAQCLNWSYELRQKISTANQSKISISSSSLSLDRYSYIPPAAYTTLMRSFLPVDVLRKVGSTREWLVSRRFRCMVRMLILKQSRHKLAQNISTGITVMIDSSDSSLLSLQAVFYVVPMIANPIFINTVVVVVRLYWFEKRFQHIVAESRSGARSRDKSEPKEESDLGRMERGVGGRNIVVLHNGDMEKTKGARDLVAEKLGGPESESPTGSSMSQGELAAEIRDRPGELPPIKSPSFHREVTFADEVVSEENARSPHPRLPQRLSPEQHIEFLQNQRNPKDKETLQIPGPRESDLGQGPVPLDLDSDGAPLSHQITSPVDSRRMSGSFPVKRNITIEAPDHPRLRSDTTFSKLTQRKTVNSDQTKATAATEEGGSLSGRLRTRTRTFSSLMGFGTKEKEEKDPTPYLSWQPTIGRNSTFADLTEEQREELGGIEYRSLKTLVIVLVCKSARL